LVPNDTRAIPDAVLVDEASMVDVVLMSKLLATLPVSTRLLLVGDDNQLPSVSCGRVLGDIIDSGVVPSVRLTQVFRQKSEGTEKRIPQVATHIVNGEMFDLDSAGLSNVRFLPMSDCGEIQDKIVDLVSSRLPSKYGFSPDRIQVLAAQRGTDGKAGIEIGVRALNTALQSALNPKVDRSAVRINDGYVACTGDRIMCIKNSYDLGIMNGEQGVVVKHGKDIGVDADTTVSAQKGIVLVVDFAGRLVGFTQKEAWTLELCYATTVHKSQGSSYKAVIVPVHKAHGFMLTRRLLYTALTRAEEYVLLVGEVDALKKAIGNVRDAQRQTQLKDLMSAAET
jgi:exodeoxyribonuclease V alpha subunit